MSYATLTNTLICCFSQATSKTKGTDRGFVQKGIDNSSKCNRRTVSLLVLAIELRNDNNFLPICIVVQARSHHLPLCIHFAPDLTGMVALIFAGWETK